jgi:glutamate carboxypeptidase
MEQVQGNKTLFTIFKKQADLLDLPLMEELRSGVSDANTLASCGIPVLDGLGPIGDKDHSSDEYMIKKSLKQRCQLASLGIINIWENL